MINEAAYQKLWASHKPSQGKYEYMLFLDFVHSYFKRQGVEHPVIMEIGVRSRRQRFYYEKLLGGTYFGLDIQNKVGDNFLQGDSGREETRQLVQEYMAKHNFKYIDMLFIDGDHSYAAAKRDYELYAPLTKHLVAIHDINWKIDSWHRNIRPQDGVDRPSVYQFWLDLRNNPQKSVVEFSCPYGITITDDKNTSKNFLGASGIGVEMKSRPDPELRWRYNKKVFKSDWGNNGRAYPRLGGDIAWLQS